MNAKPTTFQKLIHQFLMLCPVSEFSAPRAHKLDKAILKITKGKYTFSELLGWNIIQLTTIGAKTGQPRTMPLIGLFDSEKIALIASNFGRKHNPGWYYNLKANSKCEVQWRGGRGTYIGRETGGNEYEKYWQMAVSSYMGYEKYKERAAKRHIPVMVLELKR